MSTMQMMKTAVFDFGFDFLFPSAKPEAKDVTYKKEESFFFIWRNCLPETRALFRFNGTTLRTENYTIKTPIVQKDCGEIYAGDIVKWDEINVPLALRQELGAESLRVRAVIVSDHAVIGTISYDKDTGTTSLAVPKTKYSPDDQRTEVVVENTRSGKLFITPRHFLEKIR